MKIAQYVYFITKNKLLGGFFHTRLKIDFMTKNDQKIDFWDIFGKNSFFVQKQEIFTKFSLCFQQKGQK